MVPDAPLVAAKIIPRLSAVVASLAKALNPHPTVSGMC
jgi:hypothetical protein